MTKILIVEDHALVREAMAQRLACLEPELVCLESAGADEALALLDQAQIRLGGLGLHLLGPRVPLLLSRQLLFELVHGLPPSPVYL